MGFSPVFQMKIDRVPVHVPFLTFKDRCCLRYSQTPMVNPSIEDEEDQMLEGVHALSWRSERLQLQQDLPHETVLGNVTALPLRTIGTRARWN